MNRSSGDVAVARVESQAPLVNADGYLSYASSQARRPHRSVSQTGDPQESLADDERNVSTWERRASSDARRVVEEQAGHGGSGAANGSRRSAGSHLSLDKKAGESMAFELGRDGEPRRWSADLDIHLNEPNLVLLQDNVVGSSGKRLLEKELSVKQKVSPRRAVQADVISSRSFCKRPPSPLQPRPASVERLREDDEAEMALRASDAEALKRSDSKFADAEVKVQIPADVCVKTVKISADDEIRKSSASAMGSPSGGQKLGKMNSLRRVALSKKVLISKTKSRLLEPPPVTVSVDVSAARISSTKMSTPRSPAKSSNRKGADAEVEDDDPFKDIEVQDKFRQGNFNTITLIQWAAFFIVIGCLICTLTVKQVKSHQLWQLDLWKWFLLVLVILCGRLVSGWLIRILVMIFERNFLLRKKVLYFVYGLRKGVQNCLWLGLVLMAWRLMFDSRIQRSQQNHKTLVVVTKLLECFVIAAFIWLAKLLLVKSLASSFHVNTFFDRIQDSLYNQHVLERLLGPPVYDISLDMQSPELTVLTVSLAKVTAKNSPADPAISIPDLQKVSPKNVSAGLMKRLMNLVAHPGLGKLVTTIDESVCAEDDGDDIEINSELEAKSAAKRIFKNVAQEDRRSILREDLLRFLPADEVPRTLSLFEGAKDTQRITKKALKDWVVNVYRERKALAHSLNDTKTAVKELHRMASVAVIIIIIVVWLLVLGIATTHVLLFVSSQLLLAGFMFSNTVKQVFEAIIFLFVMHPFDVGDRCIVDGLQLIVEEMKILSTVFLKSDNEKVFYPNAVLATKPISNLYRSPDMKDFLEFSVHISTSVEKITAFKQRLQTYVERKSEHWQPKFNVTVKEIEDLNRMRLSVSMQHTINFQNYGERVNRRSDLLLEIKQIFADLGVEYRLLTQPIQFGYPMKTDDSALFPHLPPIYPIPQ